MSLAARLGPNAFSPCAVIHHLARTPDPRVQVARDNLAVRDGRRNVVSRFLAARVLRTKHGRLAEFSARRYPWLYQFPSFKASFEVSVRSRPA
jgi:hypothetical protein